MARSRYVPLVLTVVSLAGPTACDRSPAAEPAYVPVASRGLLSVCQVQPAVSFAGTAGAGGGVFGGHGVNVSIPSGALPGPTRFEVTIPSSVYAEVEIRANGQEHFQFQRPIVIAISYDRCGTPSGPLAAWHIDPDTKMLLEKMGGVNDVANRRILFSTMHLSGYAIAN